MSKPSFFDLTYENLYSLLEDNDLNPFGARLLFNWFYKKKQVGLPSTLAIKTTNFLKAQLSFDLPKVIKNQQFIQNHNEATKKFLIALEDGKTIECVLIPFQGKYTLCLSSQVGCAMKCSFCLTGTQGLTRNLKTSEIVGQLLATYYWLKEQRADLRISNLVFMGQGEPLHNFEVVHKACSIFLSQFGFSIGREKITISTAGYLPGLEKWLNSKLNVNLALSLHSTKKNVRDELIPLNKAYPLSKIMDLLTKWPLEKKRFITFEYLLIKNFNDSKEDAHELAKLLKPFQALINLIPFNPIAGSTYERPFESAINDFHDVIVKYDIPCMIRKTKGDEILAACGQLSSSNLEDIQLNH